MTTQQQTAEFRHVAVLFADLQGFTHLCERLDPEEVVEILQGIYDRLGDEVVRHGGHIDKVLGDGLMVLFGAPQAHEDDCLRAVLAGLAMQEAISELQPWIRERLGQGLGLRVGIDAGLVVYGAMGPGRAAAPTVIGDAANVAARLQRVATPRQVVVSERVRRLVARHIQTRRLGMVQLEGREAAVLAHVAVAPYAPVAYELGGPGATLIGRDQEIQRLIAECGRSAGGATTVVVITGERGIGKTRLLAEFVARVGLLSMSGEPLVIRVGNRWEVGSTYRPYERLMEALGLRRDRPELQTSGVRSRGRGTSFRGAARGGAEVEQAVRALVEVCRRMPVALVADDWDWADPEDRDHLIALIRGSGGLPVLFLVAGRSVELGDLKGNEQLSVQHLRLAPLDTKESWQLLQQHPAASALPPDVLETLVQRSGGNPAHLLESIEALIDEGTLVASGEGWVVRDAQNLEAVPESLRNSVLSRLDALPAATRELLRVCSVCGTQVTVPVIAEMTGLSSQEVAQVLEAAVEAGFMSAEGEGAYRFRTELVRTVAYNTVLRRQRRELHRRAALSLEKAGGAPHEELARHFVEAGMPEGASRYGLGGAQALLEQGKLDRATTLLTEMLNLGAGGSAEERAMILEMLAEAHVSRGNCQAGLELLLEALGLVRDPSQRARLMRQLGWAYAIDGRPDLAMRHYQQARALLVSKGDGPGQALVGASMRLLYDRP